MLVTADKFNRAATTQRVRVLQDIKVRGLALNTGDICDVPIDEARRLKNLGRAVFVTAEGEPETPKKANR